METLRQHGARYAQAVLAANNGNKRQTCRVLGITYHTLNGYLRINASQNTNDALTASKEEAGGQWMHGVATEWATDLGDQRQDLYSLDNGQPMAQDPFADTATSHDQSAGPLDDERSWTPRPRESACLTGPDRWSDADRHMSNHKRALEVAESNADTDQIRTLPEVLQQLAMTLTELRVARCWTRGELAAAAGVSESLIERVEGGESADVVIDELIALANGLRVPFEVLMARRRIEAH